MSDTPNNLEELEIFLKHGRGLVDYCAIHELSPDEVKSILTLTTASVCFDDMDKEDFLAILSASYDLICSLHSNEAEEEASLGLN